MVAKTVLIGLDGATFTVLKPLFSAGLMPFLADFAETGVQAPLRTVIPALTPPAWTSLVTGRSPGQHGIFDFFQRESADSHTLRFATANDILTPHTIWSLANRGGLRAMALNFPLTFPAPKLDGYVIPGWMPWRQLRLGCHPKSLYARLQTLPGFHPDQLAMDMAHEEKALEGCPPDEYPDWIAWHIRREERWAEIVSMLMQDDPPCELVTVLFDGVDKLQHLFWRFLDPAFAHTVRRPWEKRVQQACRDYFARVDALLAGIVRQAGPDATVIVASDHGFGPQERTFFVNAWLEQRGDLAWADRRAARPDASKTLGIGQIARHGHLLDWARTRAYVPMPSSNGLHIVRAGPDTPGGISEAEYESFRDGLLADLLTLRDPADGRPVVREVWKREDIFAGPRLELAPDLTLVLQDGGLVSILGADAVVAPRPQPMGTHRPLGVFLARGPGLRRGEALEALSILDVAPLVLHSLGLPIPVSMEGAVPSAAFEAAALATRPVVTAPAVDGDAPASTAAGLDASAEAALIQQLRLLGYVE